MQSLEAAGLVMPAADGDELKAGSVDLDKLEMHAQAIQKKYPGVSFSTAGMKESIKFLDRVDRQIADLKDSTAFQIKQWEEKRDDLLTLKKYFTQMKRNKKEQTVRFVYSYLLTFFRNHYR